MLNAASPMAMTTFWLAVGIGVIGAVYLERRRGGGVHEAGSAERHWLVRGMALAGNGVTGAMLLGTCGLIGFYGYDGFLYAIGLVAGWFAALLLGPTRVATGRTGGWAGMTPGVRRAAAVATLVVCGWLGAAEVIAAGVLLRPMLGETLGRAMIEPHPGAGALALLLAWLAGEGTTWRSLGKGILLILVLAGLAAGLGERGLAPATGGGGLAGRWVPRILSTAEFRAQLGPTDVLLPNTGPWANVYFARVRHADGSETLWRYMGMERLELAWDAGVFVECQKVTRTPEGRRLINHQPESAAHALQGAGFIARLPEGAARVEATGPVSYVAAVQESNLGLPRAETVTDAEGTHVMYYPEVTYGVDYLLPGRMPGLFAGLGEGRFWSRLNLASLMLALFGGVGVVAGMLGQGGLSGRGAGKAAALGVAAVGTAFLLMLLVGLGALTGGWLDPSDTNRTALLAAGSFGEVGLAAFCLAGLVLVAGTMRGLMVAGMQALGDLRSSARVDVPKRQAAYGVLVVAAALVLGMLVRHFNAVFLVGWACNIAAAALLPAMTLPRVWRRATEAGMRASIFVGLMAALGWILLSRDAFELLYGCSAGTAARRALVPFNQPALVALPLAYGTLVVVSLLTRPESGSKEK